MSIFFNKRKPAKTNNKTTQKPKASYVCQNCGVVPDVQPKRSKKCESCGDVFYVRTNQTLFDSFMLTRDQTLAWDFFEDLAYIANVTEEDFRETEKRLSKQWNRSVVSPLDTIWGLSNDVSLVKPDKGSYNPASDMLQKAKSIKFSQAHFTANSGKDPSKLLRLCNEYELQLAKTNGMEDMVKGFSVMTKCCEPCDKIDGDTFTEDDIKKNHPLPQECCTRKLNKGDDFSWCVCLYNVELK